MKPDDQDMGSPRLDAVLMSIHAKLATLLERSENQRDAIAALLERQEKHEQQDRADFAGLRAHLERFTDERRIRSFWNPPRRRDGDLKLWHGLLVLLTALVALLHSVGDLLKLW